MEEEIIVPVEEVTNELDNLDPITTVTVDYTEIIVNRLDFLILLSIVFLSLYVYSLFRRVRA